MRSVFAKNYPQIELLPATVLDIAPESHKTIQQFDKLRRGLPDPRLSIPEKEAHIDAVFADTGLLNAWKHSALNFDNDESLPHDVYIILMVRHPMSWLLSLFRKPYHAIYPLEDKFEDFLTQCWPTVARDRLNKIITTPIDLWNLKLESYKRFYECYSDTGQVRIIKFEDFAWSQKSAISGACRDLQLSTENFIELTQSTKEGRKDVNWYRNYYQSEMWRIEVSQLGWQILDHKLDRELSRYFNYVC